MRPLFILALLVPLAGCSSSTTGDPVLPGPVDDATGNTTAILRLPLYSLDETVTGTSPPDPNGPGGPSPSGPAMVATFDVPANVTRLRIEGVVGDLGSVGAGRIEVYDPAGTLVYASEGTLGGAVAGIGITEPVMVEGATPGTYDVQVWVGGSLRCVLEVEGEVPADGVAAVGNATATGNATRMYD